MMSTSYEKNGLSSEPSTESAALEGQVLSEEAQLAKLGYKQEFTRDFSWISTFSFAFSISGLLATVVSTWGFPLAAGGPPATVWCWYVSLKVELIVGSLEEQVVCALQLVLLRLFRHIRLPEECISLSR